MISVASHGEVMRSDVTKNTLTQFGEITMEEGRLDVNAEMPTDGKSGSVVILGGQFFMDNSKIQTLGDAGTGDIKIVSTEQLQVVDSSIEMKNKLGNGGKIVLHGQNIELDGGEIISQSIGQGQGGSIEMKATNAVNMDTSTLMAVTFDDGNSGDINIEVNDLALTNGAQINASSDGNGKSGTITINAETININGYHEENGTKNPSGIASSAFSNGNGNTIYISAHSLNLDNWATIQTLTKGEGNAGDISINVHDLRITNGADIDASNEGTGDGKGGNIKITAMNSVLITAQFGEDESKFVVKEGFLGGIFSIANNHGEGGNIELTTRELILRNSGVISVGSEGTGDAGNMTLNVGGKLNLDNAAILTKSQQVGGDISIKNPDFFTVNKSQILANAINKDGGNIRIIAEQFIKSSDSFLDASSELGIDGSVHIGDELVVLPRHFLRARLQKQCATILREDKSHFVRVNWLGVPRDELEGGVLGSHHDL